MTSVLISAGIVAGIGLLAGIILSVASVVMAVPKDETAEAIEEILPGANCGACGYSGCSGYAAAISKGEATIGKCSPGGREAAEKIAKLISGGEGDIEMEYNVALIKCVGSYDNTSDKMIYDGLASCAAAMQLAGGRPSCSFGCIGLGDCTKVCDNHGVEICNGLAHINYDLCVGCGKCSSVCPRNIIQIVPKKKQAVVRCQNCDKGPATGKVCKAGCIGCGKCKKACESGAIKVENFKAQIDPALCTGCGKCVEACPKGCLMMIDF